MSERVLEGKFILRNDTAANWQSANPVLDSGEMGVITDTGDAKVGNGTSNWQSLPSLKDGVNSIKDTNSNSNMNMWLGTQQEYTSSSGSIPANTICIIK